MKKFTKVMLIIAGSFTAVGIGLSVGGIAMGATVESTEVLNGLRLIWEDHGWENVDDSSVASPKSGQGGENRTYNVGAAKELEIELWYDEFIMESYDGDDIRVEVAGDKDQNVRVTEDGDEVKVESIGKKNDRIITLFYPENMKFEKIDISVDTGTVTLEDRLEAEELSVEVGIGQMSGNDAIVVGKAEIEVGSGKLDLTSLSADKLEGQCGQGNMRLKLAGKETDYSYRLECGLGEISLGNFTYTALGNERSVNNPGFSRTVELECGMGEISVDFEN